MAKVSPVSIKYMIYASFRAEGPLEKPDVIGAIFGQTEGLLGDELELRELQKEGKIGRIEVSLEIVDGKSVGEIQIPTALDKSETTIVAAALETVDRVGPTEAKIEVNKIEDVRGNKRDYIIERAKKLLEGIDNNDGFGEMSKTIKEESRAEKIKEYGEERLPAGDISGKEIIVVEGRADVVNMLRNRVNNVIGMNGTKLPLEIAKLGNEKEITLFVDGDRGGKLIANNVINNAKVYYVAVAPDGKEVEELQGKEILMSLRKRISVDEYLRRSRMDFSETPEVKKVEYTPEIKDKLKNAFEKIRNTKLAILLDSNLDILLKSNPREASRAVGVMKQDILAVLVDGSATAALIRACDERGVQFLGAISFSSGVEGAKVNLISF